MKASTKSAVSLVSTTIVAVIHCDAFIPQQFIRPYEQLYTVHLDRSTYSSSLNMNPFYHDILNIRIKRKQQIFANKSNNENDNGNDTGTTKNEKKEKSMFSLFSINDKSNDQEPTNSDLFQIEEPKLLLGDLIAMLLTCQLLGLMDILDKPEFWSNGGFAQPVDLSPEGFSSIGTLIKRDSAMSIAWLLSSIKHRGYTIGSVFDDITAIKCSFTILVDYCSLLIVFTLITAFGTNTSVDAILILRQAYYTMLVLCSFRVLFGRLIPYR